MSDIIEPKWETFVPRRKCVKWTSQDDVKAIGLFHEGMRLRDIAGRMGKTPSLVHYHLAKLGVGYRNKIFTEKLNNATTEKPKRMRKCPSYKKLYEELKAENKVLKKSSGMDINWRNYYSNNLEKETDFAARNAMLAYYKKNGVKKTTKPWYKRLFGGWL